MKRINNLYSRITSMENLELADKKARKGKKHRYGIDLHDRNKVNNLVNLQEALQKRLYKTSDYSTFKIYEPKERTVFRLPYYPDRITHHAVMNILESVFVSKFTADTYSCIKNKGIHAALRAVKSALRDKSGTTYCLKLDITKFYPSVDHDILKEQLESKFKDQDLLWLLSEIIDSTEGLPIGNYLSQYLANFYLTGFDHWIKETQHVKYYFRYADDLVILSDSKEYLHDLLHKIRCYLRDNLKLKIKPNYQVFPVEARSIDFVGYRFYHTHILMRKSIKKSMCRMLKNNPNPQSIASYNGWATHCNSRNLIKTLNK